MATDKHHLQLTAPGVLTLHWVRTVFPLLRSRLVRRWRQWAVLNHGQRPALCQPLPRVLNTVSVRLRNTPSALQCQSMKGNILFRQICSKDKSKTEGMNERRRQKRHQIEISNKAGWGGANPTSRKPGPECHTPSGLDSSGRHSVSIHSRKISLDQRGAGSTVFGNKNRKGWVRK